MHVLHKLQRGFARRLPELRRRTPTEAVPFSTYMNYRHAYHAGNFADVHKHVALMAILTHLKKKASPFVFVDTHAGRGCYELSSAEASRTAEAGEGIGRLRSAKVTAPPLAGYLSVVSGYDEHIYPGSPLIAAKLVRAHDRIVAIERQPDECALLRQSLSECATARVVCADGFSELPRLLPPPERRALVLVDPPYEAGDDPKRVAAAVVESYRRFATGIFLAWLPLKDANIAASLVGELRSAAVTRTLFLRLDVGRNASDAAGRLSSSGLIVINPPFRFDADMQSAQAELLPLLARGDGAGFETRWTGESL